MQAVLRLFEEDVCDQARAAWGRVIENINPQRRGEKTKDEEKQFTYSLSAGRPDRTTVRGGWRAVKFDSYKPVIILLFHRDAAELEITTAMEWGVCYKFCSILTWRPSNYNVNNNEVLLIFTITPQQYSCMRENWASIFLQNPEETWGEKQPISINLNFVSFFW